jgi:non-specific serine/threonine protein kinase
VPDSTGARDAAAIEAAFAGALWRFWYLAGHLREGRRRLEHAAAVHVDETPARLKVLIGAAVMAQNEEEFTVAAERAAEAATLARSLDDRWSLAYATFMLGNTARSQDDVESARRDYEASVRAFRDLGDEHSALLAARGLAGALRDDGERDAARKLLEDNLRRARADSNGRVEASTLGELATIAFEEARVTDATLLLRESLRLHRELGDRLDTAVDLGRAAQVLALRDHPVESARLLGFLTDVRGELGIRGRVVASMAQTTRASLGRQLSPAELDRLAGEGSRLRLEAVLELALEALG